MIANLHMPCFTFQNCISSKLHISDSYLSHSNQLILECKVHGTPNPTVVWLKNGSALTESERNSIVEHRDGTRQIIVYQPTTNDNGTYECVATNSIKVTRIKHIVDITDALENFERRHRATASDDSTEFGLTERLQFDTFLKNVTVEAGRSAKFICSVKGSVSDRQVEWHKDGKVIDFEGNSTRYARSFKGGLIICEIFHTTVADSGEFTCLIHKGLHEITTTSKLFVFSAANTSDEAVKMPLAFGRSLKGLRRGFGGRQTGLVL